MFHPPFFVLFSYCMGSFYFGRAYAGIGGDMEVYKGEKCIVSNQRGRHLVLYLQPAISPRPV